MEARSQPQDLGPAPPPEAPFATPEDAACAAPEEEVRMITILFIAHLQRHTRVLTLPFRVSRGFVLSETFLPQTNYCT
jgi:hypothetical protein